MVQPNSCKPCANAAKRAGSCGSSTAVDISTPMRRTRSPCCARAARGHAVTPPSSVMKSRRFIRSLRRRASFWQATKHEHNASPVGNAQANSPEVFSVEPEDFPAAKHVCESSVDRESKCPISSRQHYCKGLERKVVRKQRKVPQILSPR